MGRDRWQDEEVDAGGIGVVRKQVMWCVALGLFWLSPVGALWATVRYVPGGGSPAYATIQGAIDASVDADTIMVETGTYPENINFLGKNIVLTSSDPNDDAVVGATVIRGDGADSVVTFAGSELEACQLIGFTITGGVTAGRGGGIQGNGALATMLQCVVQGNPASFGGGIADVHGRIELCVVRDNVASSNGGGIVSCHGSIKSCVIDYNEATLGGGLNNCDGEISNCTIVANTALSAAGGMRCCDGTITNCILWDNAPDGRFESSLPAYSCL